MARFQLQLFYLFVHRRPTHKLCFLSCRPFVVNAPFSTPLVVSSVLRLLSPSEVTEEAIKPVVNVALTTKAYRKENTTYEWDGGGQIGKITHAVS